MKKFHLILTTLLIAGLLCACVQDAEEPTTASTQPEQTTAAATEPTTAPTTAPTPPAAP